MLCGSSFFSFSPDNALDSTFAWHPNFSAVAESAFHIIPEYTLLESGLSSVTTCRLPQEIDLIRFILQLLNLFVLSEINIHSFVMVIADSDCCGHFNIDEFNLLDKFVDSFVLSLHSSLHFWLPNLGFFSRIFKVVCEKLSESGLFSD